MKFDIQDELMAHLPEMRAFARFLAKDMERAEDLVQDASVRILAAADRFEPGTNFKAWSFTILRNLNHNERLRSTRIVELGGAGEYLEKIAPLAATQDSTLTFRDFSRAFWQLEESYREVLMLVGANGLSYENAAKVCGCEVGTIKSRVSRARQSLRNELLAAKQHTADTKKGTLSVERSPRKPALPRKKSQ